MAKSVGGAFNEFMKEKVNLKKERVEKAASSRDWLIEQLLSFVDTYDNFPLYYNEKIIQYGSFARKTKIQPLDDIDLILTLSASGCTYDRQYEKVVITVPDSCVSFKLFCHENSNYLNSKKIINMFVNCLKNIPQYENAEIKRNQEAATLKLKSYEWNFDIITGFFTTEDAYGKTYYVIPNGSGDWKLTDPRLDRERTSRVNKENNGKVLDLIRILKFWNRRAKIPTLSSYLLENMVLDACESANDGISGNFQTDILKILLAISTRVYGNVNDPKGLQGDLNDLEISERNNVSERARRDVKVGIEAIELNESGNTEASLKKWRELLGESFPVYE